MVNSFLKRNGFYLYYDFIKKCCRKKESIAGFYKAALLKHQTKVLIKMKREKPENKRDEKFMENVRGNIKLIWREVSVSRGCMLTSFYMRCLTEL